MPKPEKKTKSRTKDQRLDELADLKIRLQEAEEIIEAIRSGSVDAVVGSGKAGKQISTLQGADQPYRLLVESIKEGTITMSFGGTILFSNKQFGDMLGLPLERIIGSSFLKFISEEHRRLVEEALHNRTKKIARFQALLNSDERGKIAVEITLGRAAADVAETLTAVIADLSEQLRYQEILREERLSLSIMENSPDGIAVCDTKGMMIRASRALNLFCQESTLLKPFDEVFHIEIAPKTQRTTLFSSRDVLAGKTLQRAEARLYCQGRDVYDISLNAVPLRGEGQTIIGCLITITDITKCKEAEEVLLASEFRHRTVADNTYDFEFWINPEGRYLYGSPSCRRIYGFGPAEFFSDPALRRSIIHPDDLAIFDRHIADDENKRIPGEIEFRIIRPDGAHRWIAHVCQPVFNEQGQYIGVRGSNRDITKRKRLEEQLHENEEQMRTLADSIPNLAWLAKSDGYVIWYNRRWYEYTGTTAEQMEGCGWQSVHDPKMLPKVLELWNVSIANGQPVDTEFSLRGADGIFRPFLTRMLPLKNSAGQVLRWFGTSTDISALKLSEMTLTVQRQKLEAANKELESFSYTVSHDLKAPLRAIEGFSRMLMKKYGDQVGQDASRMLSAIRSNSEKMSLLIDALLSFSRVQKGSMSITEIDMDKLIGDVWNEIRAANQERELELHITKILPGNGDRLLIRQVLFNLISNAVKFTKNKTPGVIEITSYSESGNVVYCLKDNGAGFNMAHYGKLFGVFQRLHDHAEYEGTGIGLALVHRIINRHGGRVWAESKVDEGACFYFTLPRG